MCKAPRQPPLWRPRGWGELEKVCQRHGVGGAAQPPREGDVGLGGCNQPASNLGWCRGRRGSVATGRGAAGVAGRLVARRRRGAGVGG
eukprot:scaffold13341_cov101-Isochrysis_galbana.AAC.10